LTLIIIRIKNVNDENNYHLQLKGEKKKMPAPTESGGLSNIFNVSTMLLLVAEVALNVWMHFFPSGMGFGASLANMFGATAGVSESTGLTLAPPGGGGSAFVYD
jgi:pantoate kinase